MKAIILRSLPIAAIAAAVATAAAPTTVLGASSCRRAQAGLRQANHRLANGQAALQRARARLRQHPRSAIAKQRVAAAQAAVRNDRTALRHARLHYERSCLPGY